VAHAQLGKECVDGADLDAGLATSIAQACRANVVVAIWLKQRQSCKAFDDLSLRFRAGEALQEFLKNQTRCHDDFRAEESLFEVVHLWLGSLCVTPKCEGPDARINQDGHLRRDRSAL